MPAPRSLPLLLLLPALACRTVESEDAATPDLAEGGTTAPPSVTTPSGPASAETPGQDGPRTALQQALEAEDWLAAREALTPLIVEEGRRRAERALEEGDGRAALDALEAPVDLAEGDPELWWLRAEAAMRTAEGDSQPQFYYEDAAVSYERAFRAGRSARGGGLGPREVACLVGISRAKRMSLDPEGALTLARNAGRALELLQGPAPELDPPLCVVWGQAAFDAFVAALNAGESAQPLFLETEDQLTQAAGLEAHRRFALDQLANLHQWNGDLESATVCVEQALTYEPEDAALHQRLVGLLNQAGGRPAIRARYSTWTEAFPRSAQGAWYAAVTAFEDALDAFAEGNGEQAAFVAAETEFARCRGLDETLQASCWNYEACCRSAVGFLLLGSGDTRAAAASFRSMDALFPGGITIALGERLPNGLAGLEFVLGRLAQSPEELEAMVEAAAIADELFGRRPDAANDANNAGFFNRDAAVLLERAASEAQDPAVRAELRGRALAGMRRSWDAYQRAAELVPDDIRVVNDAGLIMTYYLRDDPEAARGYLEQARALGDASLGALSAEERAEREWLDPIEAWGDAYQNLGILHLTLLDDPAGARPFLERAREIGPPRRAQLIDALLPRVDRLAAGEAVPEEEWTFMVWSHQPVAD